ncbi:uncharacterized protein LOC119605646 [Lucilia sericata]|uniref:uncharacterized protein LOC119605646 n=1 Tax=Lucilia sericata TaxID=13632 RepID=UPI0018A7EF5A|nr:uncharacterized protein LOC119605646 [Lucilia sericata]
MCERRSPYLTVNQADFISSVARKRHITRKNRKLSPPGQRSASPAESFDDSLLRMTAVSSSEDLSCSKASSLQSLNRTSSSESLRKHHKSIDNLCFARKKLHRRAYVHEVYRPRSYTDPNYEVGEGGEQEEEKPPQRPLTIPILRIPEDDSQLGHASDDNDEDMSSTSAPNEERKRSVGVLGSLLKQTLKVTTSTMGLRAASMERLAPLRPLSEMINTDFQGNSQMDSENLL